MGYRPDCIRLHKITERNSSLLYAANDSLSLANINGNVDPFSGKHPLGI